MSTPKKPGTDLAALKARLAKKNQAKGAVPPPGGAPEAPPAAVPAPGQQLPPPGQQVAPPEPAPAVPAPGQAYQPPPPGQAYEPAPAYDPAPMHDPLGQPPMGGGAPGMAPPVEDDPFGGGIGGFDPSEGVIDTGGEMPSKSNVGLMVFVFLGGMAFGGGVGWIGHNIMAKRQQISRGKDKGAEMVEAVQDIVSARKDVSLKLDELKKKMAADPKAAASDLESLLTESFDDQVKVDALFGWQLASVHPNGVRRTFQLFDEANRLKTDLGYLAAFLSTQSDALQKGGSGPSTFAVEFGKSGGGKLVGLLGLMCSSGGAEGGGEEGGDAGGGGGGGGGELAPCTKDNASKAVALKVLDQVGTEPRTVPRGTGAGQAVPLLKDGAMYSYAVGAEPNKNAVVLLGSQIKRIEDHLEAMTKAEKAAQHALKNYAADPTVDASSTQPDPEGGGGEG